MPGPGHSRILLEISSRQSPSADLPRSCTAGDILFCETLDRHLAVYSCVDACSALPAPLATWEHGGEPLVQLAPQHGSTRSVLLLGPLQHLTIQLFFLLVLLQHLTIQLSLRLRHLHAMFELSGGCSSDRVLWRCRLSCRPQNLLQSASSRPSSKASLAYVSRTAVHLGQICRPGLLRRPCSMLAQDAGGGIHLYDAATEASVRVPLPADRARAGSNGNSAGNSGVRGGGGGGSTDAGTPKLSLLWDAASTATFVVASTAAIHVFRYESSHACVQVQIEASMFLGMN